MVKKLSNDSVMTDYFEVPKVADSGVTLLPGDTTFLHFGLTMRPKKKAEVEHHEVVKPDHEADASEQKRLLTCIWKLPNLLPRFPKLASPYSRRSCAISTESEVSTMPNYTTAFAIIPTLLASSSDDFEIVEDRWARKHNRKTRRHRWLRLKR